ncbi:membrane protein FxsA [Mycolicibacterium goodii]|uniref:FxsA family protein n=1 Tax=Mycolicibacterium goodii TaxID=134601 RepID=UPI001BDC9F8A|nr:FxsA family protein [Mycolicibacterium goodii]MBU8811271.1 membrane protein FxsA [Mycolicibacterium goodii]
MAKRLFLVYAIVEIAVMVALVATIGFGWTVLLLLAAFVVGLALAGSQARRQLRKLSGDLTAAAARGAVTDSLLVALGSVLVVVPGLASSVLGALLLLPPTRAAARPVLTAMAAKRVSLITTASGYQWTAGYRGGRGDYIDGEVIDVTDSADAAGGAEPHRLPPKA